MERGLSFYFSSFLSLVIFVHHLFHYVIPHWSLCMLMHTTSSYPHTDLPVSVCMYHKVLIFFLILVYLLVFKVPSLHISPASVVRSHGFGMTSILCVHMVGSRSEGWFGPSHCPCVQVWSLVHKPCTPRQCSIWGPEGIDTTAVI
jgi:hypothetical protein